MIKASFYAPKASGCGTACLDSLRTKEEAQRDHRFESASLAQRAAAHNLREAVQAEQGSSLNVLRAFPSWHDLFLRYHVLGL